MYPSVTVNGQELERVNQYKYLGVFLYTCFDWNHHIGVIAGKISQRLGVFRRVRRHLTLDTAKMLYHSLVLLHFDYCDVVIGNLYKANLRRLQKLQNRGVRIILKADSRTHINDMSDLKWLTIEQRHKLHTSVMVYKVMNSLAPNYLCKYFTELSDMNITHGKTRGLLEIPKKQLARGQRTFQYRGTKLWNDIPQHVHDASSLDTFHRVYSATAV